MNMTGKASPRPSKFKIGRGLDEKILKSLAQEQKETGRDGFEAYALISTLHNIQYGSNRGIARAIIEDGKVIIYFHPDVLAEAIRILEE